MMDDFCYSSIIEPRTVESLVPIAYRLVKLKCGEMILQGNFPIQKGFDIPTDNWKTIPTVSEEEILDKLR